MYMEDTLLGREEFKNHARQLAKRHGIPRERNYRDPNIVPGIISCLNSIKETSELFSRDLDGKKRTVPAAEWLVDNYYMLKEQINEIRKFFRNKTISRLPVVNSSSEEKYYPEALASPQLLPRIYIIAHEIVSHTDGVVDGDKIFDFINAYQEINHLTIDEIWVLGIMIKTALLERICSIASKLAYIRKERDLADKYADGLINIKDRDKKELEKYLIRCFGKAGLDRQTLIEHFTHRIKAYKNLTAVCRDYFNEKLSEFESDLEKLVRMEHELQTSLQVSIGNCITSLRELDALDYNALFPRLCRVEQILREDPAGCYEAMDRESRDFYRKQVIRLARLAGATEINVARTSVKLAMRYGEQRDSGEFRKAHVGYYLVGPGMKELMAQLKVREGTWNKAVGSIKPDAAIRPYMATVLSVTAAVALFLCCHALRQGNGLASVLILLLVLVPAMMMGYEIASRSFSKLRGPATLPRLDFENGVPEEAATIIIIPALLSSEKRVEELFGQLEVLYAGNGGENIYFALVGDLKDAPDSYYPQDRKIAAKGLEMAAKLNAKYMKKTPPETPDNMVKLAGYPSGEKPIFYFFLRKRVYNDKQGKWMGWERKRGAIIEFNNLLMRKRNTTFNVKSTPEEFLPQIRYVITLDADTKMTTGTAVKLIGAAAHPLNRPVINYDKGIVEEGYAIFQPRVTADPEAAGRSLFSRIFTGHAGIDIYSSKVSDLYMDLCGEGIFTGKGLYDPRVFNELLEEAIPENRVLSHDLLESCYLRAGFISDVEFFDEYPAAFNSYAMRLHRWVRGDWQISSWLFRKIYNRKGNKMSNPINRVSRWKILDNLRRSLLDPALFALLLTAVFLLPVGKNFWILTAVFFNFVPSLFYSVEEALGSKDKRRRHRTFSLIMTGCGSVFLQRLLNLFFLPYMAKLMLSAISTTLFRLLITGRNMLEWVTAADAERSLKGDLKSYARLMAFNLLSGILLIVGGFISGNLITALLCLLLGLAWLAAPYIAYYVSQPMEKTVAARDGSLMSCMSIPEDERRKLRILCRQMWAFYEDFTGKSDNYLPPDNVQFDPVYAIAHRTSPTNIGFYLLSAAGAYDMGFITKSELYERLLQTFNTMKKLEKWKGHLYNWYNTITLKALRPMYVSTVDSGNLAGYMMVVSAALREEAGKDEDINRYMEGLMDLLYILGGEDPYRQEAGSGINPLCHRYIEEIKAGDYREDTSGFLKKMLDDFRREEVKTAFSGEAASARWYGKLLYTLEKLSELLQANRSAREKLARDMKQLAADFDAFVDEMKFEPLYNRKRGLFSIGFDCEEGRISNSYYDLLASEARQASFIAVARREVPVEHWYRLGRRIITFNRYIGLASWSGTLFEYLMPCLIMKNPPSSLLNEAVRTAVLAHESYIKAKTLPWGISESGFYAFDLNLNYQYKAFGVPDLGFKRGLGTERVIAPYASLLALSIDPEGVIKNLRLLAAEGAKGEYGFFEAIDYTPERTLGQRNRIVKSYMAHHQGMSLASIINFLNNGIMRERFHSIPAVKSAEMLLKEKVPLYGATNNDAVSLGAAPATARKNIRIRPYERDASEIRRPLPETLVLSNNNYYVLLTNTGMGYSKRGHDTLTAWYNDGVSHHGGLYVYIRNLSTDKAWSNTFMPQGERPDKYEVNFSSDKASFTRWDGDMETCTLVTVSPEDDVEIRRIKLVNHGDSDVDLEITSYTELAMAPYDDFISHPAFSKLFIRTEFVSGQGAILASRRSRKTAESDLWLVCSMLVSPEEGTVFTDVTYDTDAMQFPGRGYAGLPGLPDLTRPLAGSIGAVLNPAITLRRRVKVPAGSSANVYVIMGAASSRDAALKLMDKYNDTRNARRAFDLSYTRSIIEAEYLNITEEQEALFSSLLAHVVFLSPVRRKFRKHIEECRLGRKSLWPYGISGDMPMVVSFVRGKDDDDFVELLADAHRYLRVKGISCDFVFIANDPPGYFKPVQEMIMKVLSSGHMLPWLNQRGGFFIVSKASLSHDAANLFINAARIVLDSGKGAVWEQLRYHSEVVYADISDPYINGCRPLPAKRDEDLPEMGEGVLFDNGTGCFSADGREYIIYNQTPAPWINVISNGFFGFNISESGVGYTWRGNSRENKLTRWSNDPVSDPVPEVIYLLDRDAGEFRSLTPRPCGCGKYMVRHGFGYTVFESEHKGLLTEMTLFTTENDPVKISLVKISNNSNESRNLRLFYYLEPVLGVAPHLTSRHIITWIPEEENSSVKTNALFIRNSMADEARTGSRHDYGFCGEIAYIAASGQNTGYTGDRLSFLGLNGGLARPAALLKGQLDNRTGGGLPPCAALSVDLLLEPGQEAYQVFLCGLADDENQALETIRRYTEVNTVLAALDQWKNYWLRLLTTFQVFTPDKSLNLMLNGWLMYQTLACRVLARSAFYQSGGAFGFRDQIQDSITLLYTDPELARKQILLHCRHQFREGDVQHWWHEPDGKGIRSRYSDDLLWLPYAVSEYLDKYGDYSILDLEVPYLESPLLKEDEMERYELPVLSEEKGTVYDHCIRAIEYSLKYGERGLPLIGGGDWNDGMNLVGARGKGESVWLAWFTMDILRRFIPICERRNDSMRASRFRFEFKRLFNAVFENAWDGRWFRRAFFDDGSPLGSAANSECSIDSISQTWAVIAITNALMSGLLPNSNEIKDQLEKITTAMDSVMVYLADREHGIVKLLHPPFDEGPMKPGYIKGYVPGVRENGGQYTHAAVWFIIALARMGMISAIMEADSPEAADFSCHIGRALQKAQDIFHMINPINHARTPIETARYRVEPYVVAADVYSVGKNAGRGGWSWYTGAAGWMYRAAMEEILGIRLMEGKYLLLRAYMPAHWESYRVLFTCPPAAANGPTVHDIQFVRHPESFVEIDGVRLTSPEKYQDSYKIPIFNDGLQHSIVIYSG